MDSLMRNHPINLLMSEELVTCKFDARKTFRWFKGTNDYTDHLLVGENGCDYNLPELTFTEDFLNSETSRPKKRKRSEEMSEEVHALPFERPETQSGRYPDFANTYWDFHNILTPFRISQKCFHKFFAVTFEPFCKYLDLLFQEKPGFREIICIYYS